MITLNLNEDKRLKFSYGVANIHPDDIMGNFILDFGDTFIGFPIKIDERKIVVEVKSLGRFLSGGAGIIKGRLEVVAGDTFLTPWRGDIKINGPIKMKVEEEKEEKPAFEYVPKEKLIKPLFKDEDHLKTENIFSEFLKTPIEELI